MQILTDPYGAKTDDGTFLKNVHSEGECKGQTCVVHNPSPHVMRLWKTTYEKWATGYCVMRICPTHGKPHPDPDGWAYGYSQGYNSYDNVSELKKHFNNGCCGCCRPHFSWTDKNSEPLDYYSLAYTFYMDNSKDRPVPQEFPMTPEIAQGLRKLAFNHFSIDLLPTRCVEQPPYNKGITYSDYISDNEEFLFLNPFLIRSKQTEFKVCFTHYRSGFTASWPVCTEDGEATMSQEITEQQFIDRVYKPSTTEF